MRVFVTGSTGFLGINLCKELIKRGYTVNALYRSGDKANHLKTGNIHLFKGDVTDIKSLEKAMLNCEYVFHLAAYAQVWAKNPGTFYDINYTGALNVLNVAAKVGVKKIIVTSTAGVFGPSEHSIINEESKRQVDYFSLYESTKAEAEKLISERAAQGLNVVIVNPSRIYGPGLLSTSNGVTRLIRLYIKGNFRILPGNGKSIGNYVYIEDVVIGHILALENGKAGERYILGGENVSYIDFFKTLSEVSAKKYSLFRFPVFLMLFVSNIMLIAAKLFGIKPLITPGLVKKYNYNWEISSNKAQTELGYNITPLKTGIIKTIDFLVAEKLLVLNKGFSKT